MFASRPPHLRPAGPADRYAIQALTRYEQRVHLHLDWRPVEDWLGQQPFLVLERAGRMVGALACPPDLPDVAWIRLMAVADGCEADATWGALWPAARTDLAARGLTAVAGLSLDEWTQPLYEAAGFGRTHDVVVLRRSAGALAPQGQLRLPVHIRIAQGGDEAAIITADQTAFRPPWQLSAEMLRSALRQADYLTVAEQAGRVVGYQLTTGGRGAVHLARLAVLPEAQGAGLGAALVADLVTHYNQRGGREITVNTQHTNTASLAVYQKMGFQLTGVRLPVYQLDL